jgi:hypothetical protein
VAISYSAESPTGTALVDASTGSTSVSASYLVRAGEPASIELTFSSTTTRAGLTGLSPVATLKDSTGGTLTTGDYKNATVTITMTGDTNRIISGSTAPTTDGVARFPNLVVAGTAATNGYTLTFSVSFLNSSNVTQTISRSQVISITAGTPTTLAISSTSQTVVNRATLSDIALTVQDDYGNAAAFSSPASIAATVSAGSNLGLTPTVSGTTTRSTDTNTSIATFSGLSLAAKVDTYTLTFASSGLASTTHTVRVTHGAAAKLLVSTPTTAANDRTFGSNVSVSIVDADENLVTTGSQASQNVTLSVPAADPTQTLTRSFAQGSLDITGHTSGSGLTANNALLIPISEGGTVSSESLMTFTLSGVRSNQIVTITSTSGVKLLRSIGDPLNGVSSLAMVTSDSGSLVFYGFSTSNTTGSLVLSSMGNSTTLSIKGTAKTSLIGTTTQAASGGQVNFPGLALRGTIGDKILTASITSPNSITNTSTINLRFGDATQLALTRQAAGIVNRLDF